MFVIEEVETFLAIARSGSLTQAARIVHASQSTVSYRLDCLEKRLGQTLVLRARGTKGIGLTPAGRRYLDLAEQWEHLVGEAARIRSDRQAALSVGSSDAINIYLFDTLITRLLERSPRLHLTLETGRGGELCDRVVSGHLDVAFVFYEPFHTDLHVRVLARYPMVAVFRELDPGSAVSLTRLADGDEIYLPWGPDYDLWRERHLLGEPAHIVTRAHSLAPVLRAPGTWALVPAFMVADLVAKTGCRTAPVTEEPPERTVYWVERKRRRAANAAALQVMEEVLAELF
ncbi:LysR family transcriptional regulator [Nonomuraea sp. NPDC050643]|uniref:LysR family transcriptional regulator n=1 Tax=Nonomuraea sp. NPDC050643 TaxID=3155660 RepID=UPI0033F71929